VDSIISQGEDIERKASIAERRILENINKKIVIV
jgi:hypothetical protein